MFPVKSVLPEQALARAAGICTVMGCPCSPQALLCKPNVNPSYVGNWIRQNCPESRISPVLVLSGKAHFSGQWDSPVGAVPVWCPGPLITQVPKSKTTNLTYLKSVSFIPSLSIICGYSPTWTSLSQKGFFRYLLVFYELLLPFFLHQHWCLQLFSHIIPVLSLAAVVQFFLPKWVVPVVLPLSLG